jgi:hypothetical protein
MVALAAESVRSKNPVNHYIMSWREGEQPSPEQVEEAVSIFMEELGWKDHQAIYGLHADTDNIHLHIAINRVHPETLKIVKINRGFDIELAHKAIARIEHAQGWQREQNGRYQVLENGELGRAPYDPESRASQTRSGTWRTAPGRSQPSASPLRTARRSSSRRRRGSSCTAS